MARNIFLLATVVLTLVDSGLAQQSSHGRETADLTSHLRGGAGSAFDGNSRPIPPGADSRSDAVKKGLAKVKTYQFNAVDFPGAFFSTAVDSNGPTTVGNYSFGASFSSFTVQKGVFLPLSVPGASITSATAINRSGQIAGTYTDNTGASHGFLDVDGAVTTIDYPGEPRSSAEGINNSGNVAGWYFDGRTNHGFLYDAGAFSTLDYPGATMTSAEGINSEGDVVGTWSDQFQTHGFLYKNGAFSSVDFPLATSTSAFGINDAGDIVGNFEDANGFTHGFLYSNGTFNQIDVEGAATTFLNRIQNNGHLIGAYVDQAQEIHGLYGR